MVYEEGESCGLYYITIAVQRLALSAVDYTVSISYGVVSVERNVSARC